MKRALFLPFVLLLSFVSPAFAQETRATITGRITDPSGASVPNAKIAVTNELTGLTTDSTASSDGVYTVPFLQPGKYTIQVNAEGFSPLTRKGVTLQSGDHLGLDLPLTVGGVNTAVTVTADVPLIQTATATASQVLTQQEIENLPDNGRSPLALAKTEYGVVPKQKNSVVRARPFDNSAASDYSIGGGNSQSNEYLLNGVVNMQDSSRLPGFSPFQDSVSEVRVDVFQMNASFGDTSGGTVNMTTKAGTNQFHGTASDFNQFSAINAPNRWFAGTAKQPATRQNQYGGTIGGPIWIPHVINGHNKLFFFYAYEGFKGSTPASSNPTTVPTPAERKGDFSALLPLGCTGSTGGYNSATGLCSNGSPSTYQIYNPFSGTTTRQRIPFNNLAAIPGHPLNPVALNYLQFYPLPNLPGNPDGSKNYAPTLPTVDDYNSHLGRIDFAPTQSDHFMFQMQRSEYQPLTGRVFPNIATGTHGYTVYQGGMLDYVHIFSPSVTMDNRLSLTRSYRNSQVASAGFDATSLGFPGYMQSSPLALMPSVSFSDGFQTLSAQAGTNAAFDTVQLFSSATALRGAHTMNLGVDIRQNKYSLLNVGSSTNIVLPNGSNPAGGGYSSGYFVFGTNFTGPSSTSSSAAPFGAGFSSFLLGLPTSGQININPQATYNEWYFAGFAQDDWKATHSLTVNYGLRFESESSITEAHNKGVFFDPTATNSVTTPAATKYAQAPYPGRPAANFSAAGGLRFLGVNGNRNFEYYTPAVNISPRVGLSFAPEAFHDKMVVRAGFGLFFNPFNDYYIPQNYGFSSITQYVATNDAYVTPAGSLSDPFPASNPIQKPVGSSLGTDTFLGTTIISKPNTTLKTSYSERWNFDIQYQLSTNTMINVGYIGNHQVNQPFTNAIGAAGDLPFLSRSARGPTVDATASPNDPVSAALAAATVPNPFKGLPAMKGGLATANNVTPYQILQNFPEYETGSGFTGSSVTQQLTPGGSAQFHELLFRFQKRSSYGLTTNLNFEYSHNLSTSQLNPGDAQVYGENASDFPVHLAITNVYQLPFGRGRWLFSKANRLTDALIGGYTVNAIYQYLSGAPIQWGTQPYFANGTAWDSRLKIHPRNITSAFDRTLFGKTTEQPSAVYNYRTFPAFYGRQDATNNLDASILKDFSFGERVRLQYRFEAYNVLNHTIFGAPSVSNIGYNNTSFGVITSTSSTPRVLQQGLRLVF